MQAMDTWIRYMEERCSQVISQIFTSKIELMLLMIKLGGIAKNMSAEQLKNTYLNVKLTQ